MSVKSARPVRDSCSCTRVSVRQTSQSKSREHWPDWQPYRCDAPLRPSVEHRCEEECSDRFTWYGSTHTDVWLRYTNVQFGCSRIVFSREQKWYYIAEKRGMESSVPLQTLQQILHVSVTVRKWVQAGPSVLPHYKIYINKAWLNLSIKVSRFEQLKFEIGRTAS